MTIKPRSESAEKKRNEIISKPAYIKAFEKALADRKNKKCAAGHDLTKIANAHVGDLKRMGIITCDPCNRIAQARYNAGAGEGRAPRVKTYPHTTPKGDVVRVTVPPSEPETVDIGGGLSLEIVEPTPAPVAAAPTLEEAIAHLQETRGLSRKSAMQFIRRAAKKAGK